VAKSVNNNKELIQTVAPLYQEVLEQKTIENLQKLGQATNQNLLKIIADIFLKDTVEQLNTLAQIIERKEQASLQQTAHYLKGNCGNIGATQMVKLAGELELVAKGDDFSQAYTLRIQLQEEFDRVCTALSAYLAAQARATG
jgi:HPt (histidine-containing phosphotransfer) domain-containing protein